MGLWCLSRGGPMAAAEGHIKRWGLYNHWCQTGCQMQHKWLSAAGCTWRGLSLQMARLQTAQQKASSLLPTPLPCRGDRHTEACIYVYMHKVQDAHMMFTHAAVNIYAHGRETFKHTQTHTQTHRFASKPTRLLLQRTHHRRSLGPPLSAHTTTQPHNHTTTQPHTHHSFWFSTGA